MSFDAVRCSPFCIISLQRDRSSSILPDVEHALDAAEDEEALREVPESVNDR